MNQWMGTNTPINLNPSHNLQFGKVWFGRKREEAYFYLDSADLEEV